jgi:hypothetical protein
MTLVTNLVLVLLVTVVFPVASMLAGSWLIVSAYDETSALRRGFAAIAAHWTALVAVADLDREYEQLTAGSHPTPH